MKNLIILSSLFAAINAMSLTEFAAEEWELFKVQHLKKYDTEIEDIFRMKIFMENTYKINRHNQMYEMGEVSYKLSMNRFGDMLHHEFLRTMNGYKKNLTKVGVDGKSGEVTFNEPNNVTIPKFIDWRTKGAVTEIKDQEDCGSCWAFSATGSLEGQHYYKTGELVSLSEQNLIDCSGEYGNDGCDGGLMDSAFKYVRDNNGIDTESFYPYEGKNDKCRYNVHKKGATCKGVVNIPEGDEKKLKIAVATVGPIAVAIDAGLNSFQFYSSGVYYEKHCSSTQLDHGVLVVGYGTNKKGQDYWLVKNSWGKTWGMSGYIQMARNRKNNCGVATMASYPLV